MAVAGAVARQAIAEGVSQMDPAAIPGAIRAYTWEPVYHPYERINAHDGRDNPDFAI
jgi:hypothetical protein